MAFALLTAAVDPDAMLRGDAPPVGPLGARGDAGDAARAGPRARRARMAEAQRCRAGAAPSRGRGAARGDDRRAGSRARPRGDARAARLRAARAGRRGRACRGAATTSRSRRRRSRSWRWRRRPRPAVLTDFNAYPQLHAAPLGGALALSARAGRLRAGAVRRPPGHRVSDDVLMLRSRDLPLPGRRAAGAARRVAARRAGRVRRRLRPQRERQVDAARRGQRRSCRTSTAGTFDGRVARRRPRHARPRAGRHRGRRRARCSRTPRRRS